jgi:hypothetical protein
LAIVLYLVIGILVKKFVYGAKGIELIPNISFWRFLFSFGKSKEGSNGYNINSEDNNDFKVSEVDANEKNSYGTL